MSTQTTTQNDADGAQTQTENDDADPRARFCVPDGDEPRAKIQGCPRDRYGCGRKSVPYAGAGEHRVPRCRACGRPVMFGAEPRVNADGTLTEESE